VFERLRTVSKGHFYHEVHEGHEVKTEILKKLKGEILKLCALGELCGSNLFQPLKAFLIVVLLVVGAGRAHADLEWITGGVPKNTPEKSGSTIVHDVPAPEQPAAAAGNQDVVLCHLTTCTEFKNNYPLDPVNFFYKNKNKKICYFAYFLIKPSSRIHTATVECYSPSNFLIAKFEKEYRVGFTDQTITIHDQTYQYFLLEMTMGMDHMNAEYGQTGLPMDTGLYTLHLMVDGQLVGITFFNILNEPVKIPSPIPNAGAANADKEEGLPMNPSSPHGGPIAPVPQGLQ
jgi:hypothetical protein